MSYRPYPGQYQQPAPQQPQYQQYPPQYPPQYYRPPRPRRPKSGSAFVAMVLAIVVVILLGVALYMPWWGAKMDMSGSGTVPVSWNATMSVKGEENLYEAKSSGMMKGTFGGIYYEQPLNTTTSSHENDVKTVYDLTFCFTIISFILWIVAIISTVLVGLGVLRPGIGAIPLAIGLILAIIAPIYFALALPPAQQKGLEESLAKTSGGNMSVQDVEIKAIYGSSSGKVNYTTGGITMLFNLNLSWAPTWGWYLALVALVMGGIALGLVVKRPRVGAPYPQYRPAPVQPQYQQYPQPPPYYPPPR